MEGDAASAPLQPFAPSKATVPLSLTCAIIEGRLVADPSSEEEALAAAVLCTTVDGQGNIVGAPLTRPAGEKCYLGGTWDWVLWSRVSTPCWSQCPSSC